MNGLKHRGIADILIVAVDGLKVLTDAIAAFLGTVIQTFIGHLLRTSVNYASWKDRRLRRRCMPSIAQKRLRLD